MLSASFVTCWCNVFHDLILFMLANVVIGNTFHITIQCHSLCICRITSKSATQHSSFSITESKIPLLLRVFIIWLCIPIQIIKMINMIRIKTWMQHLTDMSEKKDASLLVLFGVWKILFERTYILILHVVNTLNHVCDLRQQNLQHFCCFRTEVKIA